MKAILTTLVLILTLSSLVSCNRGKVDISSYEDCVAAGHPQIETYPGQCVMPDGTRFIQETPEPLSVCVNQCSDGQCQEIVCLGSGCPCAETRETCPQDCKTASP